jgi:hypothetical protein
MQHVRVPPSTHPSEDVDGEIFDQSNSAFLDGEVLDAELARVSLSEVAQRFDQSSNVVWLRIDENGKSLCGSADSVERTCHAFHGQ